MKRKKEQALDKKKIDPMYSIKSLHFPSTLFYSPVWFDFPTHVTERLHQVQARVARIEAANGTAAHFIGAKLCGL
jgi:hypothetical protein